MSSEPQAERRLLAEYIKRLLENLADPRRRPREVVSWDRGARRECARCLGPGPAGQAPIATYAHRASSPPNDGRRRQTILGPSRSCVLGTSSFLWLAACPHHDRNIPTAHAARRRSHCMLGRSSSRLGTWHESAAHGRWMKRRQRRPAAREHTGNW